MIDLIDLDFQFFTATARNSARNSQFHTISTTSNSFTHFGTMSTLSSAVVRPSDQRRKALNEELTVPLVSNFFPIERYYEAADKVYDSFQEAFRLSDGHLDDAYVYGKRYCLFCIDAIPTHNYYSSEKNKHFLKKHTAQVDEVIRQISIVVDKMDVEEIEKQKRKAEMARAANEKRYKSLKQRADRVFSNNHDSSPTSSTPVPPNQTAGTVEASAISKLNALRAQSTQQDEVGTGRVRTNNHAGVRPTPKLDPSGEERTGIRSTSRYRLPSSDEDNDDDADEEKKTSFGALPPPMLPPPSVPVPGGSAPPSYDQALAGATTQRSGQYHQRKFLGPADAGPLAPPMAPPLQAKQRERIPMRQLQDEYRKVYAQLTTRGKIEVLSFNTYQGRVGQSTNGCTVISALVAARHLGSSSPSIADSVVEDVIDRQCGPLLREIRGKLGLGGHALIIPSDVHDHLVDKKLLDQKYFEGVAGGNVMDPNHMGEFLKLISVGEDGKGQHRKAAATFFFHEHVISIAKNVTASGAYYDLIDSLPSVNVNGRSKATRTRCADIEALACMLRWYTSRKFSDSNCSYIDRNPWDDAMADFDPRVFQGFVWHVKSSK